MKTRRSTSSKGGLGRAAVVGGRAAVSFRRGYTILELLVAMTLLLLLGGGLVALLDQGLRLWSAAESESRVYERARVLLEQLASDLRSVDIRSDAGDDNAWIRFLADYDPWGRQRLRLVRSISGETEDPLLREGGRFLSVRSPDVYDGKEDALEAERGTLGAPGGLMEVFYGRDPREGSTLLWRGVRTPIGGAGSLFADQTVESGPARPYGGGPAPRQEANGKSTTSVPFRHVATPIADGILFLGFTFWGPTTNTWNPEALPLRNPRDGQASGPLLVWDSTRAILDSPGGAEEFTFRRREGSLDDPSDDIFPAGVEVTLVLRDERQSLGLRLGEDLSKGATTMLLSKRVSLPEHPRDRFILVEDEWIAVDECRDREVKVATRGRGARDTGARIHRRGSAVSVGYTLRRIVEIPGHRRHRLEEERVRSSRRIPWR